MSNGADVTVRLTSIKLFLCHVCLPVSVSVRARHASPLRNCLSLRPAGNLFRHALGNFFVSPEMHGERTAPLSTRAQLGGITEHFRKWHHCLDDVSGTQNLGAFQAPASR